MGTLLVAAGLAGCSRREGTMSEILITLVALYLCLDNSIW